MRKAMIAGNWKMYKDVPETTEFLTAFLPLIENMKTAEDREVVLCSPFTDLFVLRQQLDGKKGISFGAQDVYWQSEGAFTGEISASMLKSAGCTYTIVGHSERRMYFGETDETVRLKIEALWQAGIQPIYCIGESLADREAGQAQAVVGQQLKNTLTGLDVKNQKLTVAYDPIWAIGTGKTASNEDAQEMAAFIRATLKELFDEETAESVRILYGGSVKPGTIDSLMQQPDVDGALVGGASLIPQDFARIVRFE